MQKLKKNNKKQAKMLVFFDILNKLLSFCGEKSLLIIYVYIYIIYSNKNIQY